MSTTTQHNEQAAAATAPLKIDDLLNITIKGARVMYAIPDTSEGGPRLTTVKHAGVHYVLIAEPGTVTISKVEDDAPTETTTAPAQTRVPDERVEQILAELNGFVDYGPGFVDYPVDKAIAWAKEQPEVAATGGPILGHANVQLVDGTVIEWDPDRKQWEVTVSDDAEAVSA